MNIPRFESEEMSMSTSIVDCSEQMSQLCKLCRQFFFKRENLAHHYAIFFYSWDADDSLIGQLTKH